MKASQLMRDTLRTPVRAVARSFGFEVVPARPPAPTSEVNVFQLLNAGRESLRDVEDARERAFLSECARHLGTSTAQNFQDVFALYALQRESPGFFVEFGSTDGISLSNSYLLETRYGWSGILAEPARCWSQALRANRRCSIDLRCVWTTSGEKLSFVETAVAELSTIGSFAARDMHSGGRTENNSSNYEVTTISLNDLLRENDAPQRIDFLSIDTEGSEYPILSHFDFDAYDVKVITVEHNYVEKDREQIRLLLESKGYRRIFEKFSGWDDWYVKSDVHAALG